MRAHFRSCAFFVQTLVLMTGVSLGGAATQLWASDSRAQILQRIRPETIEFDSRGAVTFMRGRIGRIDPKNAGPDAARLMEDLAPLFSGSDHQRFVPLFSKHDELGQTHVRLQQWIGGLPVVGGEGYVHADAGGNVVVINGTMAGSPAATTPMITASEAIRSALRASGITGSIVGEPELTYVIDDARQARLAWAVDVEYSDAEGPQRDRLFADATNGSVAARHPQHHFARNRRVYSCNNGTSLPGVLRRSEGQGPVADTVVNEAYDATGDFYDYYWTKFGRDSYDGLGATILSSVHYGNHYGNAFWSGTQLVFGDGDGVYVGVMTTVDAAGHELTHAVTERESGLFSSGESGGLNESISDIFAANIEAWVDGGINADTWKIGEDFITPGVPGDAERYMDDPAADNASLDFYTPTAGNRDVHYQCGISNLAYVLLVQGGTHPRGRTAIVVPGIGMSKAEQIFYRAQTTYLLPGSKFLDARNLTVQAATDLYGSIEANAVSSAWAAVGVGTPASVDAGAAPMSAARILGVSPNPFRQSTRIRLGLAKPGDAEVRIYDAGGRLVRGLTASGAAGERFATWDGRDEAGSRVASGIYFARLAGAPAAGAVRFVRVK